MKKFELDLNGALRSVPAPTMKKLLFVLSISGVAVLGSTLAANISLGTSSALEFGQGVQVTSACDNVITLTPKAVFINGTSPSFVLSTVGFTGVDASSTTTCQGKTLSLNAYGETDGTPLQLATVGSTALTTATIGINAGTPTATDGTVVANVSGSGTTNLGFDLGFSTPSATSGAVYKLTLQSSN